MLCCVAASRVRQVGTGKHRARALCGVGAHTSGWAGYEARGTRRWVEAVHKTKTKAGDMREGCQGKGGGERGLQGERVVGGCRRSAGLRARRAAASKEQGFPVRAGRPSETKTQDGGEGCLGHKAR